MLGLGLRELAWAFVIKDLKNLSLDGPKLIFLLKFLFFISAIAVRRSIKRYMVKTIMLAGNILAVKDNSSS